MTEENQISQPKKLSLIEKMAGRFSIDSTKLLSTLKATAFKQKEGSEVTNEQMAALLVVADQYGLNPFTREIYAFQDKRAGIIPVVGVDGWSRIINDHPASDGFEFRQSEKFVTPEHGQSCPEWMEVVIHRKDRAHPIVVREYIDEVYRAPFVKDGRVIPGPWQTHTKRFFRHKTLIQGARIAYGFGGIYDEDEAARIIDMGEVSIVESNANAKAQILPAEITREVVSQTLVCLANQDAVGLKQVWDEFDADQTVFLHKKFDSTQRAAIKKLLSTLEDDNNEPTDQ